MESVTTIRWNVYVDGRIVMSAQCEARMKEHEVRQRLMYDEGLPERMVLKEASHERDGIRLGG
jgi:hypothetical protein